jgi:hypothetical protein
MLTTGKFAGAHASMHMPPAFLPSCHPPTYSQEWGSRFQEELVDEYLAEGSAQLERLKVSIGAGR